MLRTFSLGIDKIWDELAVVQASGLYWINIDRENDANLFCQQIIRNQPKDTRSALICSGQNPSNLLGNIVGYGPEKLPLFTLPEKKPPLKISPMI
ncbi:cellulose biosynthesis protein BcsE [Yersinia nurmii]|uniref:Cellulose biosynthesis protein BcsE n=1 Tax=Yersinia nurmii TaxID=685706 RepID=A0ABP1YE04_9GAMM|nr:cellulose biosynthesis protein BcsE [Yersinia nurmii]